MSIAADAVITNSITSAVFTHTPCQARMTRPANRIVHLARVSRSIQRLKLLITAGHKFR